MSVAGGSQVQFADLLFYSTNTTPLEPGIIYENTYFELNVGINDINIAPISSGYYSYTISPSLPEGLSFDPNTGAIMGTPTTATPDSSYNVCATDGATEQVHCTTLTIVTVGCAQPSFSRFDITKINKAKGSTESWKMYNSDGELIIESTGLNNENQNWNFCIPAGIYQFDLTDGDIDGWDSGSMLVVSMFGTGEVESTRYTLGRLTVMYVGTQTYYINSKMSIWSNNHWRYQLVDSSFDPTWAQGSFDDQSWPEMTVPSETTSRIWLFRKQFELTSRANYTGFLMRLYSNTGFIVYVNGVEFYRYHVTEGDLSMSTLPTSPESVFSWKSFTGDLRLLNLGTNTIAVAVVNPAEISQPLISTYDSILILLCSSSQVSRTWDIMSTDDGHRDNGDASNLFDYNKDSRYIANISMNETRSVQISFLNRAEYINKYCFTSHFDAPQHDPRDWNIYVSHDNGNSFSLVASESDIFFDGRGERQCFFFVNSYQPATDYKFEFTHPREDRETNAFALSELELLLENLEDLSVPDLAYTPNVIQAYRNQPFPALSISSLYYHHFTVSPPLPAGLTLDYGDGQIMGSTSEIVTSAVYTITALNHLNVEKSTTLTISVVSCHNPNTLFSLEFVFEEKGYEASFELYRQATSELIDSRPSIVSYFTSVYTYCSSATIYSLVLHDTANDGWGSGSYRVLLEDGTVLTTGTVSPGSSPLTVSINVGYVINPLNSIWKYTKTQITDPQWTSLSFDDSQWSTAPLTSISSLDTTTIFLRFPFEAVDLDLYSNYEINIYALGGFIAYMNGQEIYRENLPADGVSASTFGESENTEWTKYSISLSVQFNSIVSGQNILALEYHRRQADDTSSQLRVFMTMILDNTYRIIEGTFWSDEILTGNEGTDKLFDNSPDTKLCRGSTGIGNQFSWIYTNRREVINRYTIISANDCNKRHPSGWNLEGSNDDVEYTLLHSTTGQYFTSFKQAKTYNIPNTVAYKYYRLTITEMNNSKINWIETCPGDNFQLSEFQLFTARLNNPCLPVDGYPAVLNGDFGRKSCPANYEGYYQRRCNDGIYGEEEDLCTLSVPTVSYPASPYTALQNLTMTPIVPVTTGLTEVFSIAPPLPAGVSFDISTGVLSGQPTELSPSTEYTVTVANSAGSSSTTFFFMVDTYRCPAEGSWSAITIGSSITIDCPDPVNYEGSLSRTCFMGESEAYWSDVTNNCEMRAPVISYQSTSYSFFVGQPIAAIVPQVTYIVDAGFTVEPNLPAGLVLDPATGSVSGTPSVISPMNEYVVTASNTGGKTGTAVLSLAVVTTDCAAELPWPTTSTGQVASVPCTPTDIYEGYQTRLCTLSVWGVPDTSACLLRYPYGVTYPAVISVAKDFQMNPVTPSYMGQVDSWSITPMLPTGLSFDTATGTISGTAYSEGEYTFSVTAINARGSSFVSIVIHVVDTICDYDDWPHTEVGQTASKPCDEEGDYDGQQTCVCLNGTPAYFGPVDRSQCRKKAPTDILYSPSTITVTLGEPILMTATFKHIVEDIVISPPLPNGLVLNHLTGEISGISTQATSRVDYTLIFKNSDRSSSPVGITISIVSTVCNAESGWSETTKGETASKACDNPSIYEGLQTRPCIDDGSGFSPYWGNVNTSQCKKRAPYNIALSQSEIITYVGQTIMVSSTYSGLVENVVVDPALPTGLSLTVTGTISGTASAVLSRQEFNLIFKNSDNQSEAVVLAITILRNHCLEDGIWGSTIMNSYANAPCENTQNYEGFRARYCSVVEPNTAPEWGEVTSTCTKKAPFNIQYPTLTVYAEVGTIVNVVPSYSGIVESVSINPALPPGLSYSSLTGAITGTPTTISELTTYYITFSNSDASASPVSISIVVVRSTCLTDGIWLETGKGQTLSLPCNDPDNYEGNQFRLCIAGGLGSHPTWGTINTSQCKKRAPYNVFYSTIVGEFGVYMNEAPNVHGIVESVEITPALPAGLTYSLSTGVISGSPSTVIVPTEYTAIFRNSDSASVPYVFTIEIKGYCLEDNDWAKTERGQIAYIPCYSGVGVQRRQCGVSSTDLDYVWQTVDVSDCLLASREDTPEYGFVHLYVPLQVFSPLSSLSVDSQCRCLLCHGCPPVPASYGRVPADEELRRLPSGRPDPQRRVLEGSLCRHCHR